MQLSVVFALVALANASPEWDRGLKHLEDKEYQKAIDVFEPLCRSGALNKTNEGLCWGNVAEGYLHLHNYDKAVAFADKAVQMGDSNSNSRLAAGYLGKNRFLDALRTFKKAAQRARNFYGASSAVNSCMLNSKNDACLTACKEEQTENDRLRTEACRIGRKTLMDRCNNKGDIAACEQRCDLEFVSSKSPWASYAASFQTDLACQQKRLLTFQRARKRADQCLNGNADACELNCKEDHNAAACEKGKLLRAAERADRLTKCENRDEVACVTACEIDTNPAACSVLETLRLQTIDAWKQRCAAKDGEACDELGAAYRDGKQGRVVDKGAAAEFYMQACRVGRESSCAQARAIATPPIVIELEGRACQAGDDAACRAKAVAQVAAGAYAEGVATLDKRCPQDIASCVALGQATQQRDPPKAERAYSTACEGGDGDACLTLFDAYNEGTWLDQDEGDADDLFEERCVDVDEDAPRISTCSTMRSKIRSADRWVPGDKGPEVFRFDYGFSALLGADFNPYRTSRATVNDTFGEDALGFGIYPHAALALAPWGNVTVLLGNLTLKAGGRVNTTHLYGILSESSVSHAGPLNLLTGGGALFASVDFRTERFRLSVADVASATLVPGVQMPVPIINPDGATPSSSNALPVRIPYGGGVYGDMVLREENEAKAQAELFLGSLSASGRYRFQLTRVSLTRAIDDAADLGALVAPDRLTSPGGGTNQPGLLDEHRHRAGVRVGFNLEEFLELDMDLYADAAVGFERYFTGDYIPAAGRLGFVFRLEEFLRLDVNAGVGLNDLPSQNYITFIGDVIVSANFDDDEQTVAQVGLTRFITTHPTIAYAVVTAGFASYKMSVDEIATTIQGSLGIVDLGPATATSLTPNARDGTIYGNGSAFVDVPVGFGSLAARVGVEVEYLEAGVTAQNPGLDVPVGAPIGYGRLGMLAGVTY